MHGGKRLIEIRRWFVPNGSPDQSHRPTSDGLRLRILDVEILSRALLNALEVLSPSSESTEERGSDFYGGE